jgi:muramoyltetrapeptide carboxypeptidase
VPNVLRRGSRIAVVAPAGPITDIPLLEQGVARLRSSGFDVSVIGTLTGSAEQDFLAASDQSRGRSLSTALRSADAVWFARGGYGSARLLEGPGVRRHDPWVIGFSDATALLWARYANGCTGGVHGPSAGRLALESEPSVVRLMDLVHGRREASPLRLTSVHPSSHRRIVAPLIAGNLCVATSLIGTPWMPNLSGHIVLFEDVNEPAYKVDRMLTQWRQSGLLGDVRAIIFGTFTDESAPDVDAVLAERTADLGIPVTRCTTIGHHGRVDALQIGLTYILSRTALSRSTK